ncbi:hypothetical protein KIW84_051360 [Lathyrus oleraceus]|uniref:Retrotransposon gag domain-containing protein n=1 Tax=Pisum sativum TaxID=3888 RepID=A0A9D4WKY5_PEA|nr:hypothetical protein KIW84_051360 [Pisum sativum]
MPTAMPAGFPWGMPPNFMPEGPAPTFASMPASSPVLAIPPPVVHTGVNRLTLLSFARKRVLCCVNRLTQGVISVHSMALGVVANSHGEELVMCCVILSVLIVLACWVFIIEMAGRGIDDAAIAEALGMLAGVLGGNPNVVGLGAARQLNGAQKWLKEIERIFRVTECADNQKVRFGTHMLSEEADDWWVATRTELEAAGNAEITWAVFRERFLRKYFPEDSCRSITLPMMRPLGNFRNV